MKCQPHRLQAAKIEPEVWRDVKLFLTREELVREILEGVKRARPASDSDGDLNRVNAKIQNTSRQIEVLAERIAKLPEAIDPQALYDQLEILQKSRTEAETARATISTEQAPLDDPVNFESPQSFTEGFGTLL